MDDVLCYRTSEEGTVERYYSCKPIPEMIEIANQCYDQGHQVVGYTARGMTIFTGDVKKIYSNMYELTKGQLDEWGVKYHQLIMGKAHYDILIDDKAINSEEIKSVDDIEDFLG